MTSKLINIRTILVLVLVLLLAGAGGGVVYAVMHNTKPAPAAGLSTNESTTGKSSAPADSARAWMAYSTGIVRHETKMAPTTAGRFYAYVASAYADVLSASHSPAEASKATDTMINLLYPVYQPDTDRQLQLAGASKTVLSGNAQKAYDALVARSKSDGASVTTPVKAPIGPQYWHTDPYPAVTPHAGDWKPWLISSVNDFTVPAPPVYGSAEDANELVIIQDAMKNRTAKEIHDIQYWNAGAGTESPAGMWQNIMYEQTAHVDNATFAARQKVLAEAIADSFIACWHIKYTYWTARPSMRIPGLKPSFQNPAFPSYVSGHATISDTAAEVLAHYYPDKATLWHQDAADATRSRLTAGIHFDADDKAGNQLGTAVGQAVVGKL